MKSAARFHLFLLAVLLVVLATAGIAAAQAGTDTCVGVFAGNAGSCTPLENTISGGNGNTALGDQSLTDTAGSFNTGTGLAALYLNSGSNNTADGETALYKNTGTDNTGEGVSALFENTGTENTAAGSSALAGNTGSFNTAAGFDALDGNTGFNNTATGYQSLFGGTLVNSGSENTADGFQALSNNTKGNYNTATGYEALFGDLAGITGVHNTADGDYALSKNSTGSNNTAAGGVALYNNTAGGTNTAAGYGALQNNTSGNNNIGIGYVGGFNLTTGNNNIDIGSVGIQGESNIIRIGTMYEQTAAYIAGVKTSPVKGVADVVVTSFGQLGVMASSARYKRDIHDMGKSSDGLMKLRPVTFRYKDDPDSTRQYGLVAEEVERVYPELVVRDADGKVESVRYSTLTSMLLNELQKTRREMAEMKAGHEREMRAMQTSFEERLSRIERTIASKEGDRNLASALSR
jgi:hypothetical protein